MMKRRDVGGEPVKQVFVDAELLEDVGAVTREYTTNLTAAEMQRMFGDVVCASNAGGECELTPPARRWMKQAGTTSIPAYRLEEFCEQVHQAKRNHNVKVCWDGWAVHLYRQQLLLHQDREILPCPTVELPATGTSIELGDDAGQPDDRPLTLKSQPSAGDGKSCDSSGDSGFQGYRGTGTKGH